MIDFTVTITTLPDSSGCHYIVSVFVNDTTTPAEFERADALRKLVNYYVEAISTEFTLTPPTTRVIWEDDGRARIVPLEDDHDRG